MSTQPIVIPNELTGSGDLFISPASINAIHSTYLTITILIRNDSKLELKPELALRKTATAALLQLLFTPEQVSQMQSLSLIMKRLISVSAIESVAYRGGLVWTNMRDGSQLTSQPTSFDAYRAAVAIVHGAEAAGQLKPAVPEPVVMERKPVPPKPKPAPTMAEWFDGLAPLVKEKLPATPVQVAPPIRTTDPVIRSQQIAGVVDTLELHTLDLQTHFGYGSESPQAQTASELASGIHKLRVATSELAGSDTKEHRGRVEVFAGEVASMARRLPLDPYTVLPIAKIAAECGRLSGMKQTLAA